MPTFSVRNVHEAYPVMVDWLSRNGIRNTSRNGDVLQAGEPVVISYERPLERVVFWPERDANPFFHLHESLWMLAGRDTVNDLTPFVSRMRTFSDDGETLHGAYGHRWRRHFETDQLAQISHNLRDNPSCRRQVLSMWDTNVDFGARSKDIPCNLQATFQRDPSDPLRLNMTVFNRSNDLVWGALGANAVHFSFLLEWVALSSNMMPGKYHQVSANLHAYEDTFQQVLPIVDHLRPVAGGGITSLYRSNGVVPSQMDTNTSMLQADLADYWEHWGKDTEFVTDFFRDVAGPMRRMHEIYKERVEGKPDYQGALLFLSTKWKPREDNDWARAAREWVTRRWKQTERAADDGVQA